MTQIHSLQIQNFWRVFKSFLNTATGYRRPLLAASVLTAVNYQCHICSVCFLLWWWCICHVINRLKQKISQRQWHAAPWPLLKFRRKQKTTMAFSPRNVIVKCLVQKSLAGKFACYKTISCNSNCISPSDPLVCIYTFDLPWYNHNDWLGIKWTVLMHGFIFRLQYIIFILFQGWSSVDWWGKVPQESLV